MVVVQIAASPARVWRALTDPAEVCTWTGLSALDVPTAYPLPGQHARWGMRLGPLPVTLHDRVVSVEPRRRLAARLAFAFVRVDEEYRLSGDGTTVLESRNAVRSTVPGLGRAAAALVRRDVRSSLARLTAHCQAG